MRVPGSSALAVLPMPMHKSRKRMDLARLTNEFVLLCATFRDSHLKKSAPQSDGQGMRLVVGSQLVDEVLNMEIYRRFGYR
jgi:hypothetical protein